MTRETDIEMDENKVNLHNDCHLKAIYVLSRLWTVFGFNLDIIKNEQKKSIAVRITSYYGIHSEPLNQLIKVFAQNLLPSLATPDEVRNMDLDAMKRAFKLTCDLQILTENQFTMHCKAISTLYLANAEGRHDVIIMLKETIFDVFNPELNRKNSTEKMNYTADFLNKAMIYMITILEPDEAREIADLILENSATIGIDFKRELKWKSLFAFYKALEENTLKRKRSRHHQ